MSSFLSILGWAFLPGLATSVIQTIYYGLTIRAGDPKPPPGSPRHSSHRRFINILVVAFYLLYTIYEANYELRSLPSFYQLLGVPLDASGRDVKSRFRRLAALHHPDKARSDVPDSADHFIYLKLASETLQDEAKRFAYDRFGPQTARWHHCTTIRDFLSRGLFSELIPHYAVAAATIYILGLLGYMEFGKYYRWLILATLFLFETYAVTRPFFPPVVRVLNRLIINLTPHPPYLPFQVVQLTRKLTITVYIALSQIGPLLSAQTNAARSAPADDAKALRQAISHLELATKQLDADTTRLLELEMAPFQGDAEAMSNLQGKMREWLVQNTIRADPMVRDALGTTLRNRRQAAAETSKSKR